MHYCLVLLFEVYYVIFTWYRNTVFRVGHWDFPFWPFFRLVFRFCCLLRFPVFLLFSILFFGFLAKIKWFFRFWWLIWFSVFHFRGKSKTDLWVGLPKWFLWLCCIINCTHKLHFLIVQACLLEIYLFCRIWSEVF